MTTFKAISSGSGFLPPSDEDDCGSVGSIGSDGKKRVSFAKNLCKVYPIFLSDDEKKERCEDNSRYYAQKKVNETILEGLKKKYGDDWYIFEELEEKEDIFVQYNIISF